MALATKQGATIANPRSRTTRRQWKRYSNRLFYLFVSPWILGFLALTVIPFIYAFVMSFSNFDGISIWRWIGFQNYVELLSDPLTYYSLGRTLLFMIITVPISIAGGLGLALLVNRQFKGISIFRTIFYLPSVVPIVASAVIWRSVFARDTGALNALIERLGGPTITWLIDPTAFYALILMTLWGIGGGMIISLAGLQGIPQELQEAATVDGAGHWQVFHSVTLPLLSPILFFQVVMGMIASLQTLIQPLLLSDTGNTATNGSVPHGNYLYMVHVYEQFFYSQRFGYGSALLWMLFAIILLITILVFRSSAFWVYYEVDKESD
ncbi:carbohydrate ABC transporter permease [Dictyobacter kobayashii]|uniref:ABC transporter n=1 Tax=Dictyobacter kobayashii TaxID=2014872 RepID=A0A402ATE1_9CHLR|nr:sugar ABC transporter permease [Dictyobacter kobayashii]GCE22367.1 ABC transporter [Dictyobacter kobayashii]